MFFVNILETTLSCSAVIAVVLFLSLTIGKFFQSKYKKGIWLLIALRLLIPVSFFCFLNPFVVEVETVEYEEKEQTDSISTIGKAHEHSESNSEFDNMEYSEKQRKLFDRGHLLTGIWIAGAITFITYHIMCYLILRKKIERESYSCSSPELLEVVNEIFIGEKKRVPILKVWERVENAPFLMGVWHPCLIIPKEKYTDRDLYYIIKHEFIHWKKNDILFKFLLLVANSLHWFNPLVWFMNKQANMDIEMACDEEVMKEASFEERVEYSEIIMACISKGFSSYPMLSTGYVKEVRMVKIRFDNLLGDRKKKKAVLAVWGVALALLVSSGMIQIKEVERVKKSSVIIDYGNEVKVDIDGNGETDRVLVNDVRSGDEAYTQLVGILDSGDEILINYKGYYSSFVVTGDVTEDGQTDVLLIMGDTGSTFGAINAVVLHLENGTWKEYNSDFIENPQISIEQPKSFNREDWMTNVYIGATMIEKNGKIFLRLITPVDIINAETVKCIDASYRADGWYIENVQLIESYYTNKCYKKLLINTYDYEE